MNDKNNPKEDLVFRYSREARLQRASEDVRRLNAPSSGKNPGFFRMIFANRSLTLLFLAIVMLSTTALVTSLLLPGPNETEYKGNAFKLTAFRFEGATYVALKKTTKRGGAYTGAVRLGVRPKGSDALSLNSEILLSDKSAEEFKFKMEQSAERLEAVLEIDGKYLPLKTIAQ